MRVRTAECDGCVAMGPEFGEHALRIKANNKSTMKKWNVILKETEVSALRWKRSRQSCKLQVPSTMMYPRDLVSQQ